MADKTLEGLTIAILVTDGFEQVELTEPRKALDQAGADTQVVPKDAEVRGWNLTDWGESVPVDLKLEEARPQDFDALMLPGGVINPDKLRMDPKATAFVKAFFDAGKPVTAICHGPWMIVEADKARGRRMTALDQDRFAECRGGSGRSRSRGRRQSRHQPQTRRHPGLLPRNDQATRQRPRPTSGGVTPLALALSSPGGRASADQRAA